MQDQERIHRWITQADLEKMLDEAFAKGAEAMREAAFLAVDQHLSCLSYIRDLPLPKRPA